MTDAATITAIFGGIALLLSSVGSLLLAWKAANKATEAVEKVTVVDAKADVIHALANDNLSKATNALAVANETIKGFQAQVASMTAAKKDAQDLAMKSAPAVAARNEPPPAATNPL